MPRLQLWVAMPPLDVAAVAQLLAPCALPALKNNRVFTVEGGTRPGETVSEADIEKNQESLAVFLNACPDRIPALNEVMSVMMQLDGMHSHCLPGTHL